MSDFSVEAQKWKQRALERLYNRMNDRQREAVFRVKGPVLILAGAGSGKTTVLVNRISNLLRFGDAYHAEGFPVKLTEEDAAFLRDFAEGRSDDVQRLEVLVAVDRPRPWNVLAITFTNKAAGELKERLEKALGPDARDIMAATFHSACVRILRREIDRLGYSKSFTIYDADDSQKVVKDALKALSLDDKTYPPKMVLGLISRAKDELKTPADFAREAGSDFRLSAVARIYERYQSALKKADALDFDDIITLTVRLLSEYPEVLEYYRRRYLYVMVDEYQDTNAAQYRLVSLLSGGHRNLCVVGDDDQSIYKFRGATIENILSFEKQFPGAMVVRLEQNYRSTKKILDAANRVIANNTERKGKNLWTGNEDGEKIVVQRLTDERCEAAFIVDTVESNVAGGAKYGDHAVLYRINAQSSELEKAFVKAAIPYRIIGGLRFFERKEVKDIIAYLSVIDNPNDTVRLGRVINEPKRGIGDATVAALTEIAAVTGAPVMEVMASAEGYEKLQRKAGALKGFAHMMEELSRLAEEEPLEILFDALLEQTGYSDMLLAQGFEGQTRRENLEELRSTIIKFSEENPDGSLAEFLEEIALYTDLDRTDLEEDSVILMTMHSAKGLEYPYVFIAGCEEGLFPGRMAMGSPAEIEEERRLAYVAITRAKKQLYITTAAQRMIFGQTVWNKPSRFVGEIPGELVDYTDTTAERRQAVHAAHTPPKNLVRTGGMSAVPASAASGPDIRAGDTVSHKLFGQGLVLSATPMAGDLLVEIAFDKVGTKKLMANFAKLKKL